MIMLEKRNLNSLSSCQEPKKEQDKASRRKEITKINLK